MRDDLGASTWEGLHSDSTRPSCNFVALVIPPLFIYFPVPCRDCPLRCNYRVCWHPALFHSSRNHNAHRKNMGHRKRLRAKSQGQRRRQWSKGQCKRIGHSANAKGKDKGQTQRAKAKGKGNGRRLTQAQYLMVKTKGKGKRQRQRQRVKA